jgi:phosphoribosylglycinamide formyltransferase-1
MHRIGVLGSGLHTTFEYLCDAAIPNCEVSVVCANHPDVPLFASAAGRGIPFAHLAGPGTAEIDAQALDQFRRHRAEFVILIGYARKIGPILLDAYPDRILNIHSAPLPRFGGQGMIQPYSQSRVIAAGVRFSGPTIHLVDAEYDHGQILAHWPVPVRPDDTPESLTDRCNAAGRPLYARAIRDFVHRLDHPDEF